MPEPTTEVVNFMPNHYELKIHLVKGKVRADKSPILRIGDTVRYSSPDGNARVFFPSGSPYAVSKISDTHHHTVKKSGKFEYQCFITPPGEMAELGWSPKSPKAGGEHEVIPG
jgi:hypothetical protein